MLLDDNCCGQVMLSLPWWMKYTLWRRPFLSRGVLQRLDGPQCDQSTNKLRWDFSPAIDWKYCHQPFSWFAQFWAPADPRPALYEGKPGRGGGGEWGGTGAALPSSVVGSIIRSWDSAASTTEHNAMEVNPGISVQEHNYTYMFNFEQVTFPITCFLWLLSVHQSGGFSNFEWWVWRRNEWQQLRQMGGKCSDTERAQNWRKIESFEASWVFSDYKLSTCPQEAMPTLPTQQLHKFKWTHKFGRKWRLNEVF